MSVESAAPANSKIVYTSLIVLGVIAAIIGAILTSIIVYNYVTRVELREPDNGIHQVPPAALILEEVPSHSIYRTLES